MVVGELETISVWESVNQIGCITLHHASDGKPAIMIAQPGGTFMRIRCHSDGIPKIDEYDYYVYLLIVQKYS